MPLIESEFGREYVAADGSLDRAKMRAHVFADDTAKARLEAITHPLIRAETERQRARRAARIRSWSCPCWWNRATGPKRVQRVLVVDCPVETQIARVMRRNGFSREQVLAIIARQAPREARLAAADDVAVNDEHATLESLETNTSRRCTRAISRSRADSNTYT